MGPASLEKLIALQRNPANIRNLCILAHVDHGKYDNNMHGCDIKDRNILLTCHFVSLTWQKDTVLILFLTSDFVVVVVNVLDNSSDTVGRPGYNAPGEHSNCYNSVEGCLQHCGD